jgi:hypothetical protein
MTWQIARTYIAATDRAIARLRAAGCGYTHLRPPAVANPILQRVVPPISPTERAEHATWVNTVAVLDEAALGAAVGPEEWLLTRFPCRDELLDMKWFSTQTDTPVIHYVAETFGGQIECELAWEFGLTDRAFIHVSGSVREFNTSGERRLTERASGFDVLSRVLGSCGVQLDPDDRFRPHERGFSGDHYWVPPPDPIVGR